MMKSITTLLALLLCGWQAAFAELRIEVTKGVDNAVRVAVVPFEWRGAGMLAEDVAGVVNSDLNLSGRFDTVSAGQMLSHPHDAAEVFFRDWKLLNVEYLVIGHLRPADGSIQLHFELYNVFKQSVEAQGEITGSSDELRDMGHYVSDLVYEKLTGITGVFSTQIVYVTVQGPVAAREFRLNIADADGWRPSILLRSSEPILSAVWAPDGNRIAYVSFERGSRPAIYIRDLITNSKERITNFSGLNGAPAWSPDGRDLAMVLSRDGNPEIYIMDLKTRHLRRVTRHYAIDTEPAWTPDGKGLIFTSNRGGQPQIYHITLADLKLERLTFEGDYNARGRVLPDGKSIVMVHRNEGVFHIALLDLVRGRLTVLTDTALDESPSIAPNGSMLVYATQKGGRGILAGVSIDGGVKFNLPATEGEVREPAWSPGKRRVFERTE